ncbi:MAG: 4-hydroxythreonine-4-phosphate dehydrogenase PdxA [Saccharofermentanales bacterium]
MTQLNIPRRVGAADDASLPVIAFTLGDAAGIGPELVAKLAASGFLQQQDARPILVGDQSVLEAGMRVANVSFPYTVATSIEDALAAEGLVLLHTNTMDASTVQIGKVSPELGSEEAGIMLKCAGFCKDGFIDGFVFAPLNKAAMRLGGFNFESEHELLAEFFGITGPHGEMNVLDGLWTSRVTSHIPLKAVSANLTTQRVLDAINLAYETLYRAGFDAPRIAISAINPHGGDSGTTGREEIEVLAPAIEQANNNGLKVVGPFPADTLFIKAFEGEYDAVVTMYHDQGQIALKLRGFERGVTVAAGLPYAITTPAHGTAYDIAGRGIAKVGASEEAYRIAIRMAKRDKLIRAAAQKV